MKLRTRISLLFIGNALVPIILTTVFVSILMAKHDERIQYEHTREYAVATARYLESYFTTRTDLINTYAQLYNQGFTSWEEYKDIVEISVTEHIFEKIILAMKDGTYYATGNEGNPYFGGKQTSNNASPNATLSNISSRDHFKYLIHDNTREENRRLISDPVISLSNKERQILVTQTIFDSNGKLAGIIAGSITLDFIDTYIEKTNLELKAKFSEDANFIILSNTGAYIYHWIPELNLHVATIDGVETAVSPGLQDANPELQKIGAEVIKGKSNTVKYVEPSTKEKFLCTYLPVAGTAYSLLILYPEKVIYEDLMFVIKTNILVIAIIALIVFILSVLFSKSLINPLSILSETLKDISMGGADLTKRLSEEGNDVVSGIGKNFNAFSQSLHTIMSGVKNNAHQLQGVSDNLHQNIEHTKNSLLEIDQNVAELSNDAIDLSAAVEETSSTIHQISRNIESLNMQIETQSHSVDDSSASIEEMVANIQAVSNNLNKAKAGFATLRKDSDTGKIAIESVIESINKTVALSNELLETNEVIGAITNQTNILAMNAAIEAAHAGDAGKGFSVVADEVRKLAEDSAEQSKKIAEVLKQTVDNINRVLEESNYANKAFDTITSQVTSVLQFIDETDSAMKEQTEGSNQVLEALKKIQNITQEILSGSTEMSSGAGMILTEMERLQNIAVHLNTSSSSMKENIEKINTAILSVASLSDKNKELGDALQKTSDGFIL